jgi:hypothetical protein
MAIKAGAINSTGGTSFKMLRTIHAKTRGFTWLINFTELIVTTIKITKFQQKAPFLCF